LFFSQLEIGEHGLKLMENVIINFLSSALGKALCLSIISHQHERSE
jgi:hypothetical protein